MGLDQAKKWAEEEFSGAEFGDQRLTERLARIAEIFAKHPTQSIPQACGDWSVIKAAYRFFDNGKVKDQDILNPHQAATQKRLKSHKTILAIQDTTYLDFTHHPATKGLGVLNAQYQQGLVYHPTILLTPDKVPLGIAHHQVWQRPAEDFGKKYTSRKRPTCEKESQKWLNSLEKTAQLQKENPCLRIVSVADREADVFDYFLLAHSLEVDLLTRAAWNRRIGHSQEFLWDHMEKINPCGHVTIIVPRKKGKSHREAGLSIRYGKVSLMPPQNRNKEKLNPVRIWAVWAHEENPPKNEEAVSWMLLTTLPVSSFEQAIEKVQWYTCRWQIEVFFKILKSGCRIEHRQFESAERIKRCLALDAVIAWRVLHLAMLSRATPDLPCSVLLQAEEWQALYCFVHQTRKLPKHPPTLKEATRMIAGLGGFIGRKSDKDPGPATIWLGLQRLGDIASAWRLWQPDST